MQIKNNKSTTMKPFNFFKMAFIGSFIFIIIHKTAIQIFDVVSAFTLELALKTFLTALFIALILCDLNCFFKFDFKKKTINNYIHNNTK